MYIQYTSRFSTLSNSISFPFDSVPENWIWRHLGTFLFWTESYALSIKNLNFLFSLCHFNLSSQEQRQGWLQTPVPQLLSHILVSSSFTLFFYTHTHTLTYTSGLTKTGSEKRECPLRRNVSVCDGIDFSVICVWMSVSASVLVSHGGLCCAPWSSGLNIPEDHEKDSLFLFSVATSLLTHIATLLWFWYYTHSRVEKKRFKPEPF